MQTAQIEADPETDYGLGLFAWRGRGRLLLEHGGAVPGFSSCLIVLPDEATAVVVLVNSGRGQVVREDLLAAIGLERRLRAAVAAGHPATAEAGVEILAEGGTAADAAVAAALAACVAETVMTGLLGGGHAVVWDGTRARNLDCFVAVPSGSGAPMLELEVPFGEETVHYAVGPASCGVPGLAAGLDRLWREHGRLPWPRLVEPALRLARAGTDLPGRHAACLAMLEPVMTLNRGAELYAPGGRLLQAGAQPHQPGPVAAPEGVGAEG